MALGLTIIMTAFIINVFECVQMRFHDWNNALPHTTQIYMDLTNVDKIEDHIKSQYNIAKLECVTKDEVLIIQDKKAKENCLINGQYIDYF